MDRNVIKISSPHDPGMHQRDYSDSEVEDKNDHSDESEMRSPGRLSFIDDETVEVSDASR